MKKTLFSALVALISCMVSFVQAQDVQKSVSGTVLDGMGTPLPGVAILEKGTTNGITTNSEGTFTLICSPNATLVFSYLGFVTEEVKVNARGLINVQMREDTHVIDEVIVVAYGTAKKSSYTGSASLVKSDAIKDLPATSFQDALTGKVAGLQLTNSSGQAGSTPTIRIRGIGSMNASNEPLYVVDGVPVISGGSGQLSDYIYTSNNVMNTINPTDIESISILKDAAASSLYGSRAANGVVLITTKKGKEGKPTVTFKASVGFTPGWATDNYETANTQEQINMLYMILHDAETSTGGTEAEGNSYSLRQLNTKFNKHGYAFTTSGTGLFENVNISEYNSSGRGLGNYFDWEDAYFRTGVYQTYDMSVSGATPVTSYYTSLSYTKDEGRLKVNSFDRISGRVNLTQKIGKIFEFATNVNIARTQNKGYNDTRNTNTNYYMQSRNLSWGFYWPTNYVNDEPWTARYGSYAYNGLYFDKEWENKSTNTRLSATETLTLHLLPGLDVRSVFSYDQTITKDHLYYSTNHYSGSGDKGVVHEMRTIYEKMVSSTTATYNKQFNSHSIGLLAGFEAEDNNTDFTRATGRNFPVSTPHTISMAGVKDASGYDWGNSMVSILSKVDYNFDEKYFVSASFRRDASSKLHPDVRWGNFWSASGAWNAHKEEFIKTVPVISELRLRASYGVNGTLPSNNYGYMNLIGYGNKYMDAPGGVTSTIADDNLSWETNYNTNIGIDFGFFDQRLRGTIEYFNRDSKDLLQNARISTTTGFSSTLKNIGEMNNKGIEIELSGDIIRSKDLVWGASVNATFLKSKIVKLYEGADIIWYDPTGSDDRAKYIYQEGKPTLSFYGYEWAGVDKTNGKSVYYANGPRKIKDAAKNEYYEYFEFNGREATYDFKGAHESILGDATPDVYGGISTNLSYKGFDFGLNFIYKIGGKLYDAAYKDVADDGYYWERIRAKSYYENMWSEQNPNGTQPRIEGTDLIDAMQSSSRMMYDASFIRLKNLSLGYTIPKDLTNKVMIRSARVFFNASNLWTFANYKEADPEVNSYGTRGWETPIGKTFVFGFELNF